MSLALSLAVEMKSGHRKLSFDLLGDDLSGEDHYETLPRRSNSDPVHENGRAGCFSGPAEKPNRRKRKNKGSKKKEKKEEETELECTIESNQNIASDDDRGLLFENGGYFVNQLDSDRCSYAMQPSICETRVLDTVQELTELEFESSLNSNCVSSVELRQRSVNGTNQIEEEPPKEENGMLPRRPEPPIGSIAAKLQNAKSSLDWKQLMKDDPDYISSLEKLPFKYFMGELYGGNSLRNTTSVGNEKKRQRVYNTMFHVPWRCELLIDVGFFVCLDSFLSLLTIMPARILMTFWRFLHSRGWFREVPSTYPNLCFKLRNNSADRDHARQFQRPCAAELSDFGCLIVLACGVTILQSTDISLIYHIIRGQGTVKLYVVYNVLEIFDKLCQSFGGDVLQVLFNSAEGIASCSPENMTFELMRFILDQAIAVVAFIVHSFILLAEAITLSTCIVAHNNALMALLVSNNFSEIKSNVFKRFSKENLQSMVHSDTVERFHITAFLSFVLAQNILEAEGPWFGNFIYNALLVYICEILIDVIKHSFLAKFNELKPVTYSEFLEDLCKQTLNIESENGRTNLTFAPLAPACVVIRVLTPIYAAHLPYGPFPWRLFWICLLSAMTYIMLVTLKMMVGMGLHLHARWYVDRCLKRKHHLHVD